MLACKMTITTLLSVIVLIPTPNKSNQQAVDSAVNATLLGHSSLKGNLMVSSTAPETTILIDGVSRGKVFPSAMLAIEGLPVGHSLVKASAPGYSVIEKTVSIEAWKWTFVDLGFKKTLKSDSRLSQNPIPSSPAPGEVWHDSVSGMDFCWIPAGSFVMGSPNSDPEHFSGEDQHDVTLTGGFWMGRYEVTQGQYETTMGTNPSFFNQSGSRLPVENVSWVDAQVFLSKLNTRSGDLEYRLPSEAQWEYACRAGNIAQRYGDLDQIAWHYANSQNKTQPVGLKQPNAWGLYDMIGNVWEWCEDTWSSYSEGPQIDPIASGNPRARVLRGGAWGNFQNQCRSAARGLHHEAEQVLDHGFRVIAVLPKAP